MTTITQQTESLGRTAAGRLLDRVQGKTDSEEELGILLPTQRVKRASVRDLR